MYDHARKLAERGNLVYLVTRGVPGARRDEVYEGINVKRSAYTYRTSSFENKIRLVLESIVTSLRLSRKIRFDVMHAHGFIAAFVALPTKYIFHLPLVITTHGTELLWPKKVWWKGSVESKLDLIFEKIVLTRCDVVIAQSEGVRAYMLRIYGQGVASKIKIIPTGVDERKFSVQPKPPGFPQVLFVGTLSEIKGVNCLLDAFAKAHSAVPDLRLVLVGGGPSTQRYLQTVKEMNLDGSVKFCGPVRDDVKLAEFYRDSDIVVLPSNVGGPISCTLLEGMSSGRAVISTNVPGGIPDVLGGGAGVLIEREDSEGLASELQRLVTDSEYSQGIKSVGRAKIESLYTLDIMVDSLTELYGELGRK